MRTSCSSRALLAAFAALGGFLSFANAQSVATDPVGAITLPLRANSDSHVSLALTRPAVFEGAVASYSAGTITVSGSPAWAANQFVRVAGTQPNTYYVQLLTDAKEGAYFTVTGNGASTLQINLGSQSLTASDITAGTVIRIVPYHTLASVFPNGQGVNGSSAHGAASRQTEILLPSVGVAGTDLASSTSYYYYTGTASPGAGWRKAGVTTVLANDDILSPDTYFVVRHNVATATSLTVVGGVQMAKSFQRLATLQNNVEQDNYIALVAAAPLTLAQLDLLAGGFVGSTAHGVNSRGDQVLVYDNASVGKDKAAAASYYYYTGTAAPGAGWRKAGVTTTLANDTVVFSPGEALVIRKKATSVAAAQSWSVLPSYLQ